MAVDINISGQYLQNGVPIGGGASGIYGEIPLASGQTYLNGVVFANSILSLAANQIYLAPVVFPRNFTTQSLIINVNAAVASSNARLLIYSHNSSTGLPNVKLFESINVSTATTGIKTITTAQNFVAGTVYWVGIYASNSIGVFALSQGCYLIGADNNFDPYNQYTRTTTFGSAPSTWNTTGVLGTQSSFPRIGFKIA
jgi:hypothetical protein